MKLEEKDLGNDISLITIEEAEANLNIADDFKSKIIEKIESGERNLIISFKKVTYIDSSFLGALVSVLKALLAVNGKLVLVDVNSNIYSLFEITRLNKVFIVESSLEKAISHFG
ncbi:STAS domain-containing protein [Pseudopedobacter sp.]|uniref:STAS domain-containing protein n=1 Tax=Pseudopedobacter sp. TaxID=1936787 RepID=UPI00333F829D